MEAIKNPTAQVIQSMIWCMFVSDRADIEFLQKPVVSLFLAATLS